MLFLTGEALPDLPYGIYAPVVIFLIGWLGLYWNELKNERKERDEWSVKVLEAIHESSNAMRDLVDAVWSLYDDQEHSNAAARQRPPTRRTIPRDRPSAPRA